jgi:hypothetical protein
MHDTFPRELNSPGEYRGNSIEHIDRFAKPVESGDDSAKIIIIGREDVW